MGLINPDQQEEVGMLLHNGDRVEDVWNLMIHLDTSWYSLVQL